MSLEQIILSDDKRGISDLRESLPANFISRAGDLILDNPGTVIISTGFYILSANASETDGPPGAVAIGNALNFLGYNVFYMTDKFTIDLMRQSIDDSSKAIDFPITDTYASYKYSQEMLDKLDPSLLISIERCGPSIDGKYRNMRNKDITGYTAKIDTLFGMHGKTIGIGDGGNEIGMGNIYDAVSHSDTLVEFPTITKTSELIIASVSNWGGYGLVADLSVKTGHNLLPSPEKDSDYTKLIVDLGAVDGFSGEGVYKIDGFNISDNRARLALIQEWTDKNMPIS